MKRIGNESGFTLVELILIIVILGVLSSAAIVKFKDLQSDAVAASNIAYVGALRSAISIRYAEQLIRGSKDEGEDIIGSTSVEASANMDYIVSLVSTPLPESMSITNNGKCGTGRVIGMAPARKGGSPEQAAWVLACGATPTDPVNIVREQAETPS